MVTVKMRAVHTVLMMFMVIHSVTNQEDLEEELHHDGCVTNVYSVPTRQSINQYHEARISKITLKKKIIIQNFTRFSLAL